MDLKNFIEKTMEDYDDEGVTKTNKAVHFIGDIVIVLFAIFLIITLNALFVIFGIIFLILGLFESYKDYLRFIK